MRRASFAFGKGAALGRGGLLRTRWLIVLGLSRKKSLTGPARFAIISDANARLISSVGRAPDF